MSRLSSSPTRGVIALAALALAACADVHPDPGEDLAARAYVVSRDSDELTVIDTDQHAVIARVATGARTAHMVEVSADLAKVYVVSSDTDELVVVDARTFAIIGRIPIAGHPTHLSTSRDGRLLAVVAEDAGVVAFVDVAHDQEVARVPGLLTPHFVRWSHDGATAYVANLGAHHLTRIDVATFTVRDTIELDGFPGVVLAPGEGGFADAQIDEAGVLWAAHARTGRVLVYDTVAEAKLAEVPVGARPWIAFAEHPFRDLPRRPLVPTFGDRSVAMLDGEAPAVVATLSGDDEAYGVNLSPLTPDRAFVMNRGRGDVAIVDTRAGVITGRIDVGGTTEIASTTADGRWIIAAVSSADRLVFLDPAGEALATTLADVGDHPWAVAVPGGQNYCH